MNAGYVIEKRELAARQRGFIDGKRWGSLLPFPCPYFDAPESTAWLDGYSEGRRCWEASARDLREAAAKLLK